MKELKINFIHLSKKGFVVDSAQFRKKSIPTPRKVIRNSKEEGRGVLKAIILEAKYEAKLEFPRGRRVQDKTFCLGWGGGEYGYFLELHISIIIIISCLFF